jgi:hypothetical protein
VTVDYEGRDLTVPAEGDETHVVASTQPNGALRLQATSKPAEAMTQAQDEGDSDCRVATIDDGVAIFTVVPEHDPTAQPVAQAERRNLAMQYTVLAVIVIAVVLLIVLV